MRAAQIDEYGDIDALHVKASVKRPTAAAGQLLIRVIATSINPFDLIMLRGLVHKAMPVALPATLGGDIAGVIEAVGPEVDGFAPGDYVYGQANVVAGNSGAFAEYAVTSSNQVARMPTGFSFEEAAAMPLVGVSAFQALVGNLKLLSGQKLLIQGGSGGIGTAAIQLAKHLRAHVTTTTSSKAATYVKKLGAQVVIDYRNPDPAKLTGDYDAILDLVGGETLEKSMPLVKKGGAIVTLKGSVNTSEARRRGITALVQNTHVTRGALNELSKFMETGVITPMIYKTFELDDIGDALRTLENESVQGKIVVRIQAER